MGFCFAEPVARERECVLAAHHRPAHDEAAQRCEEKQVNQRLARHRHACSVQALTDFQPGQWSITDQ